MKEHAGVRRTWVAGAAFAVITAVSSSAFAGTVYQGSDRSYTTDVNRKAVVCDGEADARTAYVQYNAGSGASGRINDQDGSAGSCWLNSNQVPSAIQRHKTCEDINNRPDACSGWHNHF